jgi:HD-GYP domain-containing protein (c-di-GMP phosphodiesterase class II)
MTQEKQRLEVPEGLNEEYYQINPDILASFSKYRPPLNIFKFKEEVARVTPYYQVGQRLSNEQIEELADLVKEGLIFVSREDHPVYVKHISYQLDLVLVDKNLKESEVADIFVQALTMRLTDFLDQPVQAVFEKLQEDVMVLTQYLWQDIHKIRGLTRRLHREHSLSNHSFNSGIMGLALYAHMNDKAFAAGEIKRRTLDRLAVGMFIHDLGMTKIPIFIRKKDKPLTGDERTKMLQHPKLGYQMLSKLDLKFPEVEQCVLEHHERVDGKGYPQHSEMKDLGKYGRLCAVADAFSAMTAKRPYAPLKDPLTAASELARDNGFDANATKALQAMVVTQKHWKAMAEDILKEQQQGKG